MRLETFQELIKPVTRFIAGRPLDTALADSLEHQFPTDGETFTTLEAACHEAIAAGWMCSQGGQGRRFGRVLEPGEATSGFSVDVVDLIDIAGPHHRHPLGEICMVMPITGQARFDGKGKGWCVYGPGSAHRPTVTGGQALVLYLLPDGRIDFTG